MAISTTAALIIGAAVALVSAGATMYQQSEQAAANTAYQNKLTKNRDQQIEENYKLALSSTKRQYTDLQNRQAQEGAAASAEEQRNALAAADARATARTAAGEAGVSGLSVNALMDDFMRSEAMYRNSSRTNLGFMEDALSSEGEGIQAAAMGRASSISRHIPEPVEKPNYLGAALRVGGSVFEQYNKYSTGTNTSPAGRRMTPVDRDW